MILQILLLPIVLMSTSQKISAMHTIMSIAKNSSDAIRSQLYDKHPHSPGVECFDAIATGNIPKISRLLKKIPNVNIYERVGFSMLDAAIWWYNVEATELLLKKGANLHRPGIQGDSILMMAMRKRPFSSPFHGSHPCSAAQRAKLFQSRKIKIIELLLDHGALYELQDTQGRTALTYAIQERDILAAELLLQKNMCLSNQDEELLERLKIDTEMHAQFQELKEKYSSGYVLK